MRHLLITLLCVFAASQMHAQQDSIMTQDMVDTTLAQTDSLHTPFYKNLWSHDPHSVGRAALYSAVIPGLGQAYNGKYWKIPIVYGALGTSGYFIYYWYDFFDELRTAYIYRTDEDPLTIDTQYDYIPSDELLLQYVSQSKRYLDVMVIVTAAIYTLNIIDAVVDAHLYDFNVSDDLSMQVQPHYFFGYNQINPLQGTVGISLQLSLK
ncbi:MAG TPA: DUF5683 domain-containing protein [Chitinophagales bacterium]|nr:DUF5683 domain-containing protein [Chitinophagales bacterium]